MILDMNAKKPEEEFSEQETARRRDELAKRMLNTPPQPLKPKRKTTPGQFLESADEKKTFQLLFDINAVQTQLENMSPFELQSLQDRINDAQRAPFDIFIADSMPAVSAGSPDQIIIGLRFNF
jgi:hypothetical protein